MLNLRASSLCYSCVSSMYWLDFSFISSLSLAILLLLSSSFFLVCSSSTFVADISSFIFEDFFFS